MFILGPRPCTTGPSPATTSAPAPARAPGLGSTSGPLGASLLPLRWPRVLTIVMDDALVLVVFVQLLLEVLDVPLDLLLDLLLSELLRVLLLL